MILNGSSSIQPGLVDIFIFLLITRNSEAHSLLKSIKTRVNIKAGDGGNGWACAKYCYHFFNLSYAGH